MLGGMKQVMMEEMNSIRINGGGGKWEGDDDGKK